MKENVETTARIVNATPAKRGFSDAPSTRLVVKPALAMQAHQDYTIPNLYNRRLTRSGYSSDRFAEGVTS